MSENNGSVSINTENIFPIIKKWLYSEKDIFIREIISNAGDAISKLRKLDNIGEAEIEDSPEWKITVVVDKEHGTITVSDNGIGMTEEEVGKYINQIAFSGAKDFIEKYKGKADEEQIIGHFGLGFYSSFMVSTKVEIDTKSFIGGEKAVHWESVDGMNYTVTESELDERGTYIT
ncbi:MAG: ATP-binding protein, partial [Lachnospiraceae bacterium]|nr:ATP-binding protein [Lachnospiraceae bacterium]